MLSNSIDEYKIICEEMSSIRNCITNYIGLTVGSAGAAAAFLTAMVKSDWDVSFVVALSLVLSLLVTGVASIIFYKFNSYNRLAGYRKLLEQESSSDQINNLPFCWETLLGKMLKSPDDGNSNYFSIMKINVQKIILENHKLLKSQEKIIEQKLEEIKNETVKEKMFFKGWEILINAYFFKRNESYSWGFPPIPAALLFFLIFSFLVTAMITLIVSPIPSVFLYIFNILFLVIVSGIQAFVWHHFLKNLYKLMQGSSTIQSYFWQYLPDRIEFLKQQGITPEYPNLFKLISFELNSNPTASAVPSEGNQPPWQE